MAYPDPQLERTRGRRRAALGADLNTDQQAEAEQAAPWQPALAISPISIATALEAWHQWPGGRRRSFADGTTASPIRPPDSQPPGILAVAPAPTGLASESRRASRQRRGEPSVPSSASRT
jgi:hypothetical protein